MKATSTFSVLWRNQGDRVSVRHVTNALSLKEKAMPENGQKSSSELEDRQTSRCVVPIPVQLVRFHHLIDVKSSRISLEPERGLAIDISIA